MSTKTTLLASSLIPGSSPENNIKYTETLDTEMTCLLTLNDKGKPVPSFTSPTNDEMPQNYNRRNRSHSHGYGNSNQKQSGGPHNYGPDDGKNGPQHHSTLTNPQGPWATSTGYNSQGSGFDPNISGSSISFNNAHPLVSYDPSAPLMNMGNIQRPPARATMVSLKDMPIPLSRVSPGPVWPSDNQLSTAHAYGIRNDDGTFTRLIRVDEIHRFAAHSIAPRQGPEGLIILPPTRVPSPNSLSGPDQLVSRAIIDQLPPNQSRRPSQDSTQMQIDNIIANSLPKSPPRREKIYCDKWIHEGTCAFTQMGCKYLHKMPGDKQTQVSLGLNHGYPAWYRRQQKDACNSAPSVPNSISPPPPRKTPDNTRSRIDENWRRFEIGSSTSIPNAGSNTMTSNLSSKPQTTERTANNNGAQLSGRSFGPIGRPRNQSSHRQNSFRTLQNEHAKEDDEEELTYRGRNNGQSNRR